MKEYEEIWLIKTEWIDRILEIKREVDKVVWIFKHLDKTKWICKTDHN